MFIGHSGWGPGQLEQELAQGAWLTVPATLEQVFDERPDLWRRILQTISGPLLAAMLKLKHVPSDPRLN